MEDFKGVDLSKFNIDTDMLKNLPRIDPFQNQMVRIQEEQERTFRNIQRAREEKEAEELRRHNELVTALKEAGEKGATIVIGDNANGIQIQQNSDNVKAIIEETIEAVENRSDEGIIKKSLRILRELAIGTSGSLIASGIIALLGTLPL